MSSSSMGDQNPMSDLTQSAELQKPFKLLKAYAALVSNFTLQWHDLQDHLISINSSIQSRLLSLSNISQNTHQQSTPDQISETTDVKSLVLYICAHWKEVEGMRDRVCSTLRVFNDGGDLGGMVVKAIRELFYGENGDAKRSCLLVLEEFSKLGVEVGEEAREEARKVAAGWKGRVQSGVEIFGFLRFLVGFRLVGEFGREKILIMIQKVEQTKDAPELFRALGFAAEAPDFIQNLISRERRVEAVRFIYAFDLVDRIPPVPLLKAHLEYMRHDSNMTCMKKKNSVQEQEAISQEIGALKAVVRCIETYKLGSEFPPENLRSRIQQLKKKKNERKATVTAPGPKPQQQQKSGNKSTADRPKAQPNQQSGNKRSRSPTPEPASPTAYFSAAPSVHSIQASHQQRGLFARQSAQHLTPPDEKAAPKAPFDTASTIRSMHPSHHQPAGLFAGQGAHLLNQSPISGHYGLAGSAPVTPRVRSSGLAGFTPVTQHMSSRAETYGLVASAYDMQRISSTPRSYGLVASAYDMQRISSTPRSYGSVASSLDTRHMNSTAGSYGLAGSVLDAHLTSSTAGSTAAISSSAGQYGMSIGAYGSTARVGLAETSTSIGIAPSGNPDRYAPNYHRDLPRTPGYARTVSYSSGYGVLP